MVSTDDDEVNVDIGFLALFLYIDTNRERERHQCLRSGGISLLSLMMIRTKVNVDVRFLALFYIQRDQCLRSSGTLMMRGECRR